MGHSHRNRGFTLVELLIVVVILAILAAMAIPTMNTMASDAKRSAFASELRILAEAAGRYEALNQQHLPDTSTGVWPVELAGSINQLQFESETPLGGHWDTELNAFGISAAIGAHFDTGTPDNADLVAVDTMMDDGDLTTGSVRTIAADWLYYILEL